MINHYKQGGKGSSSNTKKVENLIFKFPIVSNYYFSEFAFNLHICQLLAMKEKERKSKNWQIIYHKKALSLRL